MNDNLARCAVLSIVSLAVIEWNDGAILEPLAYAVAIGFVLTLLWVGAEYLMVQYRSGSPA